MGASPDIALKLPKSPDAAPDPYGLDQLDKRRIALRQIAAKQGLQSTFLTTPAVGTSPLIGGGA